MKSISEIQNYILEGCGIKTSVSIGKGSLKGYYTIRPTFQNGSYPTLPFDFAMKLKLLLPDNGEPNPTFCTVGEVKIHSSTGIIDDRIAMKKECKPKAIAEMKVKTWGSKNSQMRLDKRAARNAKKMQKGNTARYW